MEMNDGYGSFEQTVHGVTPKTDRFGVFRSVALLAALAGGVVSVSFMLHVAHRNESFFLLTLFAIWDFSPFVGLMLACMLSKSWSVAMRAILQVVVLVITLGSVGIYGDVAFGARMAKVAYVFLIVPLTSRLIAAILVTMSVLISGRLARRDEGV